MQSPEQQAGETIDEFLIQAGWVLQDRDAPDRKAAGVIEAKKAGVTLSGVADQSASVMTKLPDHVASWDELRIYDYESTGNETFFRNLRDPQPRSRRLFAFHRRRRCTSGCTSPRPCASTSSRRSAGWKPRWPRTGPAR